MRTTVTLESDVLADLKQLMHERGISFKAAINMSIRSGIRRNQKPGKPFRQKTFDMGTAAVPLEKALQLAGQLEDEEIVREMAVKK